MITRNWVKIFTNTQDLDELICYFKSKVLGGHPQKHFEIDHGYVGKNGGYWEFKTKDLLDSPVGKLVHELENRLKLKLITDSARIGLWEYGPGDTLKPHYDSDIEGSHTIMYPLIGKYQLELYNDNNSLLESLIYGPGEFAIINNTKYNHGGRPTSEYRLVLAIMIAFECRVPEIFDEITDELDKKN